MAYSDQPTVEHHINWGGVLKGVAIVAAVVAVGVVGYMAFAGLSGTVLAGAGTGVGGHLLAGVANAYSWLQGAAGTVLGTIGHWLTPIPGALVNFFNLGAAKFTQAAAVNQAVGMVGAATVTGVAVHAAIPHLQHTNLMDTDPSVHTSTGMLATTSVPMHDLTHMTHHAAEHADEHNVVGWTQRVAPPRATSYSNFADKVSASKEERKAAQPAANFTEQLNADRANLDAALAK